MRRQCRQYSTRRCGAKAKRQCIATCDGKCRTACVLRAVWHPNGDTQHIVTLGNPVNRFSQYRVTTKTFKIQRFKGVKLEKIQKISIVNVRQSSPVPLNKQCYISRSVLPLYSLKTIFWWKGQLWMKMFGFSPALCKLINGINVGIPIIKSNLK